VFAHQQPSTIDELAFLVAAAEKNNTAVVAGREPRVPPRTQLTSMICADVSAFTKVIEYSVPDQVIHVETGIKLGDLRALLAENSQWWPVYLPDDWTLLEAINRGDSGAVEHRFSSVRDLVLGCTVVTGHPSGIINCGGKVVKNVTGYDMTKMFVGSHGTLGVVVSAQLRLYAVPSFSSTLRWELDNCDDAMKLAHELIQSGLPLYTVSISKDSANRMWNLLAQAAGVQTVVDEVVSAATNLWKRKPKRLAADRDTGQWRRLTAQFYSSEASVVQLLAPPSTQKRLAAELAALGDMEIRPFPGRILLRGATIDAVVEVASRHAVEAAPIVVAGADDQYNYVVRRSPSGAPDRVRSAVQAKLKQQFDPAGVLNPFASL
jgi:FAD/FMN-containing dehydrogenase